MEICCFIMEDTLASWYSKTTFCYREFLWFKTHSQIIKYDNINILRDRIKKCAVLWKISINLKSHAYVFWASSRRHLGLTPESSRQQLTKIYYQPISSNVAYYTSNTIIWPPDIHLGEITFIWSLICENLELVRPNPQLSLTSARSVRQHLHIVL